MAEKIRGRILTGPTGSGKSALGMRLAEESGFVIACMDSMQIYRGMDIGTAKPSREDQNRIPHYMLDLCDPREPFNVARWAEMARELMIRLNQEGKEVLFVGGTGLYMEALIYPMEMGRVEAQPEVRERLRAVGETPGGAERLHAYLAEIDPVTAAKLPIQDLRRTIRAIEVYETTGQPISSQWAREADSAFEWTIAATRMKRETLYDRINGRVTRMMREGLEAEVRRLLGEGVPETAQSMSGIGYKEMIPVIREEYDAETAADLIRLHTRHYAKRQETFLRRESRVQYIDVDQPDAYAKLKDTMK